jgi:purine-binding chemotaxis protein CheW
MSEQLHTEQWFCFQLGSETYAQHVGQVREILDYTRPVPVPGALHCVEGVLNVRGDIVTIVSGPSMLELDNTPDHCAHIIVLATNNGLVGISVGEVQQISLLTPEKMMPVDTRQPGSPVWGTIEHVQELLILTDFERSINELDSYE